MLEEMRKKLNIFEKQRPLSNREKEYLEEVPKMRKRVVEQKREKYKNRRLLAIYDFIDLPFSFDVATFIINAELVKRRMNLESIDIAFVAHASDPGPTRHSYINSDNFRHYLHNLGLEMTRLSNSIGSVFFFNNRQLFIDFFARFKSKYCIFPEDYNIALPIEVRPDRPSVHGWLHSAQAAVEDPSLLDLCAPREQVDLVRKWILKNVYPSIPITITLREWDEWIPRRNSDIAEWQKLIDYYNDRNIKFIILRDYNKLYDDPVLSGKNLIYYNEPLISVSLRAALYQESTLNLFVNNGCGALAMFNRSSRYIIYKFTTPNRGTTLANIKMFLDLTPPQNFQGATKYQELVWELDQFETMKLHLDKMLKMLKDDNVLIPGYYKQFEE